MTRNLARILRSVQQVFFPPFAVFPADSALSDVLDQIRERVITTLLRLCVLFGAPAVLVGNVRVLQGGSSAGVLFGDIAYVAIIILAWQRHIHFQVRAIVLVVLAYAYIFFTLLDQLDEFIFAILFAFVVMTTLLLRNWGGLIAVLLSLATILWVNLRLAVGGIPFALTLAPSADSLSAVIVPYVDWIFYVGIFLFTMWVYFAGFREAWARERKAISQLEAERDRLAEAFAREQVLMAELERAYQRETELSQLKSKIISTVSHEFRTPLTIIENSTGLLTDYADRLPIDRREKHRQIVRDTVFYLTDLLQDVALVEQQSQGIKLDFSRLAFADLCRRLARDIVQSINQPANLTFQFDAEEARPVDVDYVHFRQVLLNLVSNALKYSPPDKTATVTFRYEMELVIVVADQGKGIPADDLPHIWEMFYRGHNVETQRGLGLGLHIARQLLTAMGGTIAVRSAGEDQGATFTVRLPLTQPAAEDGLEDRA